MKFKCFTVLISVAAFKILNATDRELLQTFMENVLLPQSTENRGPPPAFSISPNLNSSSVHAESAIQSMVDERPTLCPRQVNISWQLKPPYTLEKNVSGDQPNVDGIFHQVLDFYGERNQY